MSKASQVFDFSNIEVLKDPEYAAIYLEECLIDGDIEIFQMALRDVAEANDSMIVSQKSTVKLWQSLSRPIKKS